jgi:hypothetical protein
MGVENRESLGHVLLPDPDVVQGLVDGDMPKIRWMVGTGTPA